MTARGGKRTKSKPPKRAAPIKRAEPAPRAAEKPDPPPTASVCPIVGIGASAGGLEALELFLRAMPNKTGLAYVIVQHLDPAGDGMLVELLQRATKLPVAQVKDRMRVEPEHVYVIPPNRDMSVLHGVLHLMPQATPRGLNLPIDYFLRSLAADCKEHAIGVILSGMGSDGTLGLAAIKEKAGATFVQAVSSAKFHGMPTSAIDAGVADVVAPVEELPEKIVAFRTHRLRVQRSDVAADDHGLGDLDKIFLLLRAHTGNDFSQYKKSTIVRRIERRMGLHQILGTAQYVRFLRENPREIELLFKELLIGVTSFFRDPASWDHLRDQVLPGLLASRSSGGVVRAWVPGCSTGEEAYSLAMVFKEALEQHKPVRNATLQIFATDLDRDAIDKARVGLYPDNIVADVSPERLRQFFVHDERGYRVSKPIREMVVFAVQNVCTDPPFTKLDILSCRNLMIYFSAELQKKLIPLFHYSLNPGGVLFLGSSETIGPIASMFSALDAKTRLFRRQDQTVNAPIQFTFPTSTLGDAAEHADDDNDAPVHHTPAPNLQLLVDRMLVQRFSPLSLLCSDKGDVLYLSNRAGKYFEPTAGKANLNVFAMARDGLRYELSRAFAAALRAHRVVTVRGIKVGTNGGTQVADLVVQQLEEPKDLRGTVLIVIYDIVDPSAARAVPVRRPADRPRILELEAELQRASEELQTTREEMQTSQEELKSANEELQSTNEELQSTNEELTTSKEEMQSLNEELQTVNNELEGKVDELSRSNNDMKNLLNSTDIATLFLDNDLNVRRFTPMTTKIIKLIAGDIHRPITDITSDLAYPDLADDAREVLRTLVFKERQATTRDGRWFVVRILPYRTLENRIDGVVITFSEANAARLLEASLRDQSSQLRQMADVLPNLVWSARPDGACDYLNRHWLDYTGVPEHELLGNGWLEFVHPDDRERVAIEWRAAVRARHTFESEFRLRNRDGMYRWFKTRSTAIRDSRDIVQKWYGTSTDVDDLKRDVSPHS